MGNKKIKSLLYYPLAVRLNAKLAVVVGGGKVAERKVRALRQAGALVRVVSPKATPALRRLAKEGRIEWVRRCAKSSDVKDARIVIAATNHLGINAQVSNWAKRNRTWINVVDQSALSNFISPAVFRLEGGIITVYTDGKDPVLSRDIKNFLKERWNDFLSYRDRL